MVEEVGSVGVGSVGVGVILKWLSEPYKTRTHDLVNLVWSGGGGRLSSGSCRPVTAFLSCGCFSCVVFVVVVVVGCWLSVVWLFVVVNP